MKLAIDVGYQGFEVRETNREVEAPAETFTGSCFGGSLNLPFFASRNHHSYFLEDDGINRAGQGTTLRVRQPLNTGLAQSHPMPSHSRSFEP